MTDPAPLLGTTVEELLKSAPSDREVWRRACAQSSTVPDVLNALQLSHGREVLLKELELWLNDGWIAWSGGECPVSGDTKVYVRFRCGEEVHNKYCAAGWSWIHSGSTLDIVAYKMFVLGALDT